MGELCIIDPSLGVYWKQKLQGIYFVTMKQNHPFKYANFDAFKISGALCDPWS